MIFVTLGSQKFQFNRLLKEIDELIAKGKIQEKVFAQTGFSDYIPQNYEFKNYLDREEFSSIMEQCNIVITHGGTGAIIGAVKKGKKVIAIPRLAMYGEHVDNHQLQLIDEFKELNLIEAVYDLEQLADSLLLCREKVYSRYKTNTNSIIASLEKFIG